MELNAKMYFNKAHLDGLAYKMVSHKNKKQKN